MYAFRKRFCRVSWSSRDMARHFRANMRYIDFFVCDGSHRFDRNAPSRAYDTHSLYIAKCVAARKDENIALT